MHTYIYILNIFSDYYHLKKMNTCLKQKKYKKKKITKDNLRRDLKK